MSRTRIELPTDALIEEYGTHGSASIAKKLNVSPPTVLKNLRDAGIPIRPEGNQSGMFRVDLPDTIADEYRSSTLEILAAKYNTSPQTIARHLEFLGVQIRPAGRPKKLK